jgi:5'-AMP-activated protein kinase catalytic alpha subunit
MMSKVSQCTANYVAPEQLACNTCVGKTTDVWSCGVILYYLLAGYFPFEDKNLPFVFQNIRRAKFTCPSWFSEDAKLLLSQILVKNPKDRITLESIQNNAWFNKGFESEAPSKHTPITVTEEQLCNAVTSAEAAAPSTTPPMLNAFDLMSCAGGLALDKLFNYHRGSHASWKRFYHFESDLPLDAVIEDIKVVMRTTGMATLQNETPTSMVFHVKRKKQHTDIHVDISTVLSGLHIVTMRCAKGGHAITYYKFMSEIGSRILYRKRLV